MRHLMIALAIVSSFSTSLHAQQRAEEILWNCKETPNMGAKAALLRMHCIGYVSGFLDAQTLLASAPAQGRQLCLPKDGISNDQAVRLVLKWLDDRPETLHESARTAVFGALMTAFACK